MVKYLLETYIGQPEKEICDGDQQVYYDEFDLFGKLDTIDQPDSFEQTFHHDDFINAGNPSPVWHAADQGHQNIIQILRKYNCNYEAKAPDGTTAKMMAILNGNKVTQNEENPHHDIIKMSQRFPLYKEPEDLKMTFSNESCPSYSEIEEKKLPELCPLKHFNLRSQNIKQIRDIRKECHENCNL